MANRNHQKYEIRVDRKVVHGGIAKRPLEQRAGEHRQKWPNVTVHQVGLAVMEKSARNWEKEKSYS